MSPTEMISPHKPPVAPGLGNSLRWGRRSFAGVFVVGAAGVCCGALPLGLLFVAAGAAGVTAGAGVAIFALAASGLLALAARTRHRPRRAPDCCLPGATQPAPGEGER